MSPLPENFWLDEIKTTKPQIPWLDPSEFRSSPPAPVCFSCYLSLGQIVILKSDPLPHRYGVLGAPYQIINGRKTPWETYGFLKLDRPTLGQLLRMKPDQFDVVVTHQPNPYEHTRLSELRRSRYLSGPIPSELDLIYQTYGPYEKVTTTYGNQY